MMLDHNHPATVDVSAPPPLPRSSCGGGNAPPQRHCIKWCTARLTVTQVVEGDRDI